VSLTLPVAREIYNACNPDESLGPDDPRNVDLDASGDDGLVRGESWARRLATKVAVANKPTCVLFTGLPGSGKSTELRRFAKIVEDEQRYLVVIADALELLDLSAEIDVPDILMVMLYRAEQAVLTLEGRSGKDALKDSPMKRLWQWMDRTDIQLKEGEVGFGPDEASTKLVFEMKTRETVRQRIRRHLAANLSAFIEEVRREFLRLEGRAKKAGREGMVLVLDSLEKLQGTSTSWEKVLESAERVFSSNASYLRLPVHTLYTIPPALSMRLRVDVEFLPMVKLRTREGKRHEAGYAAMRRLIERRVKAAHLNELLGPTTLDARVEEVIASSGGYPRELMRLLQALVESAMTRGVGFDQPTFERVLERSRDTYRRLVRASGALPWLRKVRETQRLSADSAEELSAAADMLRDNVVLRYLNDAEWYELHPAVRDMEELR
jgi:hypothetical protein